METLNLMFLEYYPCAHSWKRIVAEIYRIYSPALQEAKICPNKFKQGFVTHASVKNHTTLCLLNCFI